MRFGKVFLCLITALFLVVALFAGKVEQEPDGFLSVDIAYGDRTENIRSLEWDDAYFLYLPGGVDISRMQLRFTGDNSWALDGTILMDRMSCEAFPLDTPLMLTDNGECVGTVTFMRSSNVGAMFVETASGDMKHIHAEKGNEEAGVLRLYTQTGELNHDGAVLSINGRGNSTWNEQKKSYSLELAMEADLLDMGSAKKWILLSNVYDGTNLHNKVVYDFARVFGLSYSPDSDWVDLYLNGEYAGLYLLCERNEVHPQRVNISQSDSFLVARDAYWRFEEQGKPYITTESKAALRIHHSGFNTEELLAIWQSAENAILREDGLDPVTGKSWQELIDVESWVRKYLIDEVFGNEDGTALSQFYYYDSREGNQKIFAGPVWDYDLSMYFDGENHQESVQQFFANVPGVYGSAWPDALYRKPEYFDRIVQIYESEVLPLLDVYLQTIIPQYATRITDATAMNASRWGLGSDAWNANTLRDYLTMRTAFLSDVWLEETEYCMINAMDENAARHYYAVKPGSVLPSELRYESVDENYAYIWYDAATGDLFPVDKPIYTNQDIYVRYERVTVPEETTPAEVAEQENSQPAEETASHDPEKEPLPVTRILPLAVFVGMLISVSAAGIYRIYTDGKKENNTWLC